MSRSKVLKLLEQISAMVDDNRLDTVPALCEQILNLDPRNLEARMYLADLALEAGDAAQVIVLAHEMLEIDEESLEAMLLLAEGNLLAGEFEAVIEVCDVLLEEDPDNLEARFYMAEALLELGAAKEAAELYESIVEEEPEHTQSLLGLGAALYESCQFEQAHQAFLEVLEREPESSDAIFFVGLLLERKGDLDGAERQFNQARALDPETYPIPISLPIEAFEKVVEDVQAEMPDELREYLRNVPIVIEEIPADADLLASDPPHSPNLWGLFRGVPLAEQQSIENRWGHMPSEIVLYRTNLQRGVTTREELIEEIRGTLVHEIFHFLGLSEEEVEEKGWA